MLFRPSRSSSVLGITFILRTDPQCLLRGCCLVGRLFQFYTEEYCSTFLSSNVFFTLSVLSISPISRLHVYLSCFRLFLAVTNLLFEFLVLGFPSQLKLHRRSSPCTTSHSRPATMAFFRSPCSRYRNLRSSCSSKKGLFASGVKPAFTSSSGSAPLSHMPPQCCARVHLVLK